jgi:TPR repeat protein
VAEGISEPLSVGLASAQYVLGIIYLEKAGVWGPNGPTIGRGGVGILGDDDASDGEGEDIGGWKGADDANTGMDWLIQAADQGHADAMYRVGVCCVEGVGTGGKPFPAPNVVQICVHLRF